LQDFCGIGRFISVPCVGDDIAEDLVQNFARKLHEGWHVARGREALACTVVDVSLENVEAGQG
jgi:hypothetical protein